jgi:tight adherence protein C
VRRRLARLTAELPVILEFLALSLSAGEGVLDALRRVARTGRGELAAELRDAVAAVGAGVPLPEALARLDRELGLPPLSRALEQLIGALERGAPLGEVLRAQAQDARDGTRRALLESAGRKEIAMLVPSTMVKTPYLAVGRSAALQLVPLVSRSGSLVLSGGPSLPVVTTH